MESVHVWDQYKSAIYLPRPISSTTDLGYRQYPAFLLISPLSISCVNLGSFVQFACAGNAAHGTQLQSGSFHDEA